MRTPAIKKPGGAIPAPRLEEKGRTEETSRRPGPFLKKWGDRYAAWIDAVLMRHSAFILIAGAVALLIGFFILLIGRKTMKT